MDWFYLLLMLSFFALTALLLKGLEILRRPS